MSSLFSRIGWRREPAPTRTISFPAREPLPVDELPSELDVHADLVRQNVELAEQLDEARRSNARLAAYAARLELEVDVASKHECGTPSSDELRAWSQRVEYLQGQNEELTTELLAARGHDTCADHRSPLGSGPFIGGSR